MRQIYDKYGKYDKSSTVPNVLPDVSGPLRGPSIDASTPQATLTDGQCALGLAQFKALGLVEVFDLRTPPLPRLH